MLTSDLTRVFYVASIVARACQAAIGIPLVVGSEFKFVSKLFRKRRNHYFYLSLIQAPSENVAISEALSNDTENS